MLDVVVAGQVTRVAHGTAVGSLLPEVDDGLPVVAALVDGIAVSLATPLRSTCAVWPLTPRDWEGQRIQRRSLALLALEAAHVVSGGYTVRVGPSFGFGQRLMVQRSLGQSSVDQSSVGQPSSGGVPEVPLVPLIGAELVRFATALEAAMGRLISAGLSLRREYWSLEQAQQTFARQGWTEAADLLRTSRDHIVPVVSYGQTYAIDMGPVVTRSNALGAFYITGEDDLLMLIYGRRSVDHAATHTVPIVALGDVGEPAPVSERPKTRFLVKQVRSSALDAQGQSFEEQAWLRALGVRSIGSFNRVCIEGSVPDLIRVAEGFHEKRISVMADEIASRGDGIDIVSIAGPSSSGKSTFIQRLCVQLKVNGITPVGLGLDDYYVDRELTPRDESGDFDFEALNALNLELLNQHTTALLRGEAVRTPRFDFLKGKAELETGKLVTLGPRDVLLIEGIHGLNPELMRAVPVSRVFRIMVCPLMQLALDHATRVHASDVRLIRRIVRDRHGRGRDAAETIERWPKVRAGERRYIYPNQTFADAVFDSSLVYELSVLRVYAERYLLEVPRNHASQTTANRLLRFLDRFVGIYPDHVPGTSILREFIGNSSFVE